MVLNEDESYVLMPLDQCWETIENLTEEVRFQVWFHNMKTISIIADEKLA